MEIYFAILILISFFSMLEIAGVGILTQKFALICFSLICLMLGGLRYNTGTDWISYYSYFIQGESFYYFINNDFEVGYALLNYIIKALTNEYNVLLLIISFICVMCYYKCSVYLTRYGITVAMILFASDLYGIFPVRTTIVAAMAMLAYVLIEKKQKCYFLLLVLIATSIHRISIILIPAYWIYYRQWSNIKIVVLIIGSIIIGYSNIIFDFMSSITDIDSIYLSKFLSYSERSAAGNQFGTTVDKEKLSYYMVAFKCFLLLIVLKYRNLLEERISYFNGLFNLFLFGSCMYFLLVHTSAEIAARLTSVYNMSQYLLLAGFMNLFRRTEIRLLVWIGLFFMCLMKLFMKFIALPDAYIPYTNILGI